MPEALAPAVWVASSMVRRRTRNSGGAAGRARGCFLTRGGVCLRVHGNLTLSCGSVLHPLRFAEPTTNRFMPVALPAAGLVFLGLGVRSIDRITLMARLTCALA